MTHDYTGYEKTAGEGAMAELTQLADELAKRDHAVFLAEEALKACKEEQRQIAEEAIPEKMDEVGMESFTAKSGIKIVVKENVRASIPKKHNVAGLAWLTDNGHGHLIKRKVQLVFAAGEVEKADEVVAGLEAQGLQVGDNATVHASTLAAFVREMLSSGQDIPQDLLGVFRQRVAKIAS